MEFFFLFFGGGLCLKRRFDKTKGICIENIILLFKTFFCPMVWSMAVVLSPDSGVGAGIDSYYEYLLKAYVLLGDDQFLQRFNIVRTFAQTHMHSFEMRLSNVSLSPWCNIYSLWPHNYMFYLRVLCYLGAEVKIIEFFHFFLFVYPFSTMHL